MQIEKTPIEGLVVLRPRIFEDARGYFFESYNKKQLEEVGITSTFVQDNRSYSQYGTLRGLHFQYGDASQAKLVSVLSGKVLDVAVDLRVDSPTYGQHFSIELDAASKVQFYIPRGFAHGFVVLSETAEFFYKCDNFYNPKKESGIMFNDPELNIDWKLPLGDLILSDKDMLNPRLKDFNLQPFPFDL